MPSRHTCRFCYSLILATVLLAHTHLLNAQDRKRIAGPEANKIVNHARQVQLEGDASIKQITFEEGTRFDGIASFGQTLRLARGNDLKIATRSADRMGFTHIKCRQYYEGIEIFGAEMIFHCKGDEVKTATGNVHRDLSLNTVPEITEDEAFAIARAKVGARVYSWERDEYESLLKREKNDPSATYLPRGRLVISSPRYAVDGPFRLVYLFDIYAIDPPGRYHVEVDAVSGEVINFYDKIHHMTAATATGTTRYDGVVELNVDFDGTTYSLKDETRGKGIFTYDLANGWFPEYAEFFADGDGVFDSPEQQAGVSAHFGAGAFYDYLKEKFGRDSYDGEGGAIHSYVHFGNGVNNASWDGERMKYGDGDGDTRTEYVSMDITGHEITHAVTQYSADLIYAYEPGALNESFSDIFGQSLEWEVFPATASWKIGDQVYVDKKGTRSMSDPKSHADPDTWKGEHWVTSDIDNGGVHTNSGVMNYWYYLLVDGGSGTNDNGYFYDVPSIGRAAAEQIAFRNLTYYLTSTSRYVEARTGSELAAIDLFGTNSLEHLAVVEAWNAVGVPAPDPLMVVTDQVDFGDVPTGLTAEIAVTVANQGSGLLSVSSITPDHNDFTVSASSMKLVGGASERLVITFTPPEVGPHAGTITLKSNAGEATIAVAGVGVEPPALSVDPLSISETLLTGEKHDRTIRVGNTDGASDLKWELGIKTTNLTNFPELSGGIYVDGDMIYSVHNRNVLNLYSISAQSVLQSIPIHDFPYGITYAKGHLWIGSYDGAVYEYDLDGNLISTFYAPFAGPTALAFDGEYFLVSWAMKDFTILKMDAEGNIIKEYDNPDKLVITQLACSEGSGLRILDGDVNDQYVYHVALEDSVIKLEKTVSITDLEDVSHALGHNDAELIVVDLQGNSRSLADAPWLSYAPASGVVPIDSSMEVTVSLNAEKLDDGIYNAGILLTSNDPSNTSVTVPITLEVDNGPDISLSGNSIDFGSRFVKFPSSKALTISNVGGSLLEVASITLDHPDYDLNASSFYLAAGEEQEVVITWEPSDTGEDEAVLVIESNDPDEGMLQVRLSGSAIEPPVASATPASLSESLLMGKTIRQTLTIENTTGGSDLILEDISISYADNADEPEPWLEVSPKTGTIAPGSSKGLEALFDASLLDEGKYEALITIQTNDPSTPRIEVPVMLDLQPGNVLGTRDGGNKVIFPNPTSARVHVAIRNINRLYVTDLFGRRLTVNQQQLHDQYIIDLKGIKTGIYLINILLKDGRTISKKVVLVNQ